MPDINFLEETIRSMRSNIEREKEHIELVNEQQKELFIRLLSMKKDLKHVWFTGMSGNSQTEFKVYYIDPESKGIRAYYPFFVETKDGKYLIPSLEVGSYKII